MLLVLVGMGSLGMYFVLRIPTLPAQVPAMA
jgi:hypothetical protein